MECGDRIGEIIGVIFRQKDRQIPSMAAVIVVFFLFWNFLSHMIFALFLGHATLTNISSSVAVFLTPEGINMLVFGTGVGAVFATLLYALTVVSLPLLLDRRISVLGAVLTSWRAVVANPVCMSLWGAIVMSLCLLGLGTLMFGLILVMPILGHATWHAYRDLVVRETV